jgi:hypothetical protein
MNDGTEKDVRYAVVSNHLPSMFAVALWSSKNKKSRLPVCISTYIHLPFGLEFLVDEFAKPMWVLSKYIKPEFKIKIPSIDGDGVFNLFSWSCGREGLVMPSLVCMGCIQL